ncbi:MAG: four helix bundle protein [Chloroflexota bacterium]
MAFKFEQLEVWQLALDYVDLIYELAGKLPKREDFNLKSQIIRAATSIALNIAEGSTSQSDAEQARFLGMAIRSLIETVACQRIIKRRNYMTDDSILDRADDKAQSLAKRLHTFRKVLSSTSAIREEQASYETSEI